MTLYQGGKTRLGPSIYDAITEIEEIITRDKFGTPEKLDYFEPFIGMAGVMRCFGADVNNGNKRKLYANDKNPNIISMWKATQKGWLPSPNCSKEKYNSLKLQKEPSPEKGFYCSGCSFGGIFMGGYSEHNSKSINIKKFKQVVDDLKTVKFFSPSSYDEFSPTNMLIYCDPPYINNKLQGNNKFFEFDHNKFWNTMRKWSKNNIVVISEYEAPEDFIPIWKYKCSYGYRKYDNCKQTNSTEILFIFDD